MIKLTLTDGTEVLVNLDQIEITEQNGTTRIILKNGGSLEVQESLQLVLNLVKSLRYRGDTGQ